MAEYFLVFLGPEEGHNANMAAGRTPSKPPPRKTPAKPAAKTEPKLPVIRSVPKSPQPLAAPPPAPAPISSPPIQPEPPRTVVSIAESIAQSLAEAIAESSPEPIAEPTVQPPMNNQDPPSSDPALDPFLFEVAWEVCLQLGGIYTVLKSKAEMMLRKWGKNYFLIGPYNQQTASVEFDEMIPEGPVAIALEKLREQGITGHFGRWLIPGRPLVILLDFRGRFARLDADKYLIWKDHGIGTVGDDFEVNDVIAFGFTVTEFFRHLKAAAGARPILAHFHEWMAGLAVPRIAHERIDVSTVFTTHATLLGRYLASDTPNFYDQLPYIDAAAQAAKYLILPRFQIERAAAHASTVFTTVSEVTGFEAEKLLGRKPDLILPNGLNIKRFAALHEFQNLHRQYKDEIHEFVMGHFFPCYQFDLDNTLYLFTSGRYEYRNKGMDLFIEALYRLNQRLRWMPQRPTVVAFIVTKAATRNVNIGVLHSQSMFKELKGWCGELQATMGNRLFHAAALGRMPELNDLMDDDDRVRLKQAIHAWRTGRQPPIVTHDLVDDANDPVLKHLRHRGLFNSADDPVKVIFHPQFVSTSSPLLSLDYEQFVRGCHMGIFPSYYEPWGYTPMESIALGVPAVTADLSGFGAYVQRKMPDHDQEGIKVLDRRYRSFEDSTNDLVDHIVQFAMLTRRQRIEQRNKVERLGERFDWSVLISCYHEAHAMALSRKGLPVPSGRVEVRVV